MADKERKLKWLLWADAEKFKSGLKQAKGELGGFEKSSKSMFSNIQKAAIAAFSVTAIFSYAKTAVAAANEQLKAETKLLTALKGRADVTRELGVLASDLQKKTLFGDEATIEAAAQLAVFTKNEDQIKKLLPLIQDMATALGMDLSSAAKLVGKSIGASTNALARYGISIEGAAGSAERADSAISALTKRFEGQSEAAAKTGSGAVTQLKNAIGDLNEQVGNFIIAWQNFLATNSMVKGLLSEFQKSLTIAAAGFKWWERWLYQFESQSKTYERALKRIQGETQTTRRGFYDMANDAISADDPLMQSLNNLLSTVQDFSTFSSNKIDQLKGPEPKVLTQYEKLTEQLGELTKVQQDYAAKNKDISDVTARIAALQLEIDKIDQLIEKKTESAKWDAQYKGTYTPAQSIQQQGTKGVKGEGLDTKGLTGISDYINKNTQIVNNYLSEIEDRGRQVAYALQGAFESMAIGVSEAFANLAIGTGTLSDVAKALMTPIADLAISLGTILIGVGTGIEGLKTALATISGPIALAAGAALIALGMAAKAGVASLGTGGRGGSYSGSSGTYDTRTFSQQPQYQMKSSSLKVEVVGTTQIRNKDIYIAYQNAQNNRKLST